jgi:TonB family protein
MFRRALRENHEFLADQAVISHGTAPSWYKQILINQYVGDQIVIANNFNYSLIKIRIKMMSKIKSKRIANGKILIGVLLAISLIAVFACEQDKQEKQGTNQLKSASIREDVFVVVEEAPEYPGGVTELRKFLAQHVNYPAEAQKNGTQGKVYVTFVVNKDGSVSDAKIARGVDPLLDAEAVRIVNTLPKWKPGRQSGRDVAVQFTVPINFALQ